MENKLKSSNKILLWIVIVCIIIAVFFTVKNKVTNTNHIPLNINYSDGPVNIMTKGSDDSKLQASFKNLDITVPKGFEIKKRNEKPLSLEMVYENSSGDYIIFTQTFAKEGKVDISVPKGDSFEVKEEKINGRSAVTLDYDGNHYIIVEDGTNAFIIKGFCDQSILYDIAMDVSSTNK